MVSRKIGVVVEDPTPSETVQTIRHLEAAGVHAAWMISEAGGGDILTTYAAAAVQTERIKLGTSVVRIWSRHPVTLAQQARAVWDLAPGRLILGVGPSHKAPTEHILGLSYHHPLGHLEEYVRILKDLLQGGEVDFEGRFYTARDQQPGPIAVPVLASALRPKSFELCGRVADGAITWVCPLPYVRDTALPALRAGATQAGRQAPGLLVHLPVCVTKDVERARSLLQSSLAGFPSNPNYTRMFELSGFPRSDETLWTNEMMDALMVSGTADEVSRGLDEIFGWGAAELIVTILADDPDMWTRTVELLGELSGT